MSNKLSSMVRLGIIAETTQNTEAGRSGGDYVHVPPDVMPKQVVEKFKRDYVHGDLDTLAHVSGLRSSQINFKLPMRGSGTANVAYDPLHALLKSLGFVQSGGAAGADWEFNPISMPPTNMLGPSTSLTIEAIKDGIKHLMLGCVNTGKFSFKTGEPGFIEIASKGLYATITDEGTWPSTPVEAINPLLEPVFQSAEIKLDNDTNHVLSDLEIDVNNTVQMIVDASSAYGVKGFKIVKREPKLTATILMRTKASFDYWTKHGESTLLNTANIGLLAVLGTALKNKLSFILPSVQIEDMEYVDANGMLAVKLSLTPARVSGNDWMKILVSNAAA